MPHVKRDEQGRIVAVSQRAGGGFDEELAPDNVELANFLGGIGESHSALQATDQDFVRVLEDVVELLINKGVILFTDLPGSAQDKILQRQRLRSELTTTLDLIEDD